MDENDDLFKNPNAQSKGGQTIIIQTANGQKIQMNPEECTIYWFKKIYNTNNLFLDIH